ncbi:hypothetical protein F0562_032080 [Nyssa sinensis]|uniref:Glycine-rich protein n=1 Tax=Nyssa sinensis TaxID=561372 RepID=A0A5J5AUI6_9ASTE|nr:hypothetical protein F0562_032080 [Nyssa sinensis]
MATKEIILFLIIFLYFCCPAFLFPLGRTLSSVHLQQNNTGYEGLDENSSSTNGGDQNGIAHRSNFAHGAGGRSEGGHAAGANGEGNNGGSTSQHTPGGAAVIPIYAAGAANGHRNTHHSASSCNGLGLPALGAAILASLYIFI